MQLSNSDDWEIFFRRSACLCPVPEGSHGDFCSSNPPTQREVAATRGAAGGRARRDIDLVRGSRGRQAGQKRIGLRHEAVAWSPGKRGASVGRRSATSVVDGRTLNPIFVAPHSNAQAMSSYRASADHLRSIRLLVAAIGRQVAGEVRVRAIRRLGRESSASEAVGFMSRGVSEWPIAPYRRKRELCLSPRYFKKTGGDRVTSRSLRVGRCREKRRHARSRVDC